MKHALWVTGILGAVAIALPRLVATAYFFLIVPGIILTIAPTVFIYLAGTSAIRRAIPVRSRFAATGLSFALMLGGGWAVMQPFRMASLQKFRVACKPDIIGNLPLELRGRVLVETPDCDDEAVCDYVCLALLDLPKVDSVTVATAGREGEHERQLAAFQLQSAEEDASVGLFPSQPGRIIREFRPLPTTIRKAGLRQVCRTVEADWALRLARRERLRKAEPVTAADADWVIRFDQRRERSGTTLRRMTISDASGSVRFRRSYYRQSVPAALFYFGFEPFSGGTLTAASFHVGRQIKSTGPVTLHLESELLRAIGCQFPQPDSTAITRLATTVEGALNALEPSDVQLDLARRYLGTFRFDANQQDYPLIAKVVSDHRVKEIDDQLMNVFSKKQCPVEMKDVYAERMTMAHTSTNLRRWLAESLAGLPAGVFSKPSPAHWKIWSSPDRYRDAGIFFSRLSDLDAEVALKFLQGALDHATSIQHWNERRPLIEGIRQAFVKLGPSASTAAPRLRELFLQRPSPLMNNAGQADDWRFTLARLGVEIDDLPYFQGQSNAMVERISQSVKHRIRRYDQEVLAKANP